MTRKTAHTHSPPHPNISENPGPGICEKSTSFRVSKIGGVLYWSIAALAAALMLSLQPVYAATIWDTFSTIMRDIYGKLLGISTIIAVTAATVALLVRMISRNQRAVDEASSWLKRIILTWLVLNTLGFAISYLTPFIQGGQYTP